MLYNSSLLSYLASFSCQISFLNSFELLHIQATIHNAEHRKCAEKLYSMQERSKLSLELAKQQMNNINKCYTVSDKPIILLEDFELYTCSCNFITPAFSDFIDMHYQMKNGMLPFAGGYFEQSFKFKQIMDITSNYCAKKEEEEMKKQERRNKQKKR